MDWSRSSRLLLMHPHYLFHKCNLDHAGGHGITQQGLFSSTKLLSGGSTMELESVFVIISLGCLMRSNL